MKIFNSIIIILIGVFFSFFVIQKYIQENFSEKIKLPYPTYIINLSETEEGKRRLPIIQNIYKNSIRSPAIYGKDFDFTKYYNSILTKNWDYGKWKKNESFMMDMSDGEKGIIMSHYNIWKKLLKKKSHILF